MIYKGNPQDSHRWSALYWFSPRGGRHLTVRQQVSDGKWYIVEGLCQDAKIVDGPYESREAIEMLVEMGVIHVES